MVVGVAAGLVRPCKQCSFHIGVCLGNIGEHKAAQDIADKLLLRCPNRCEGYYLAGMITSANCNNKKMDDVKALFDKGASLDPAGPARLSRLQDVVRRRHALKYQESVKKFGEAVKALANPTCPTCNEVFPSPTPEWYCTKCWPQKYVRVWESDSVSVCCACGGSVGALARHHCRCCGKLCCGPCSAGLGHAVPVLNFKTPVRVCAPCLEILNARDERKKRNPSPSRGTQPSGQREGRQSSPDKQQQMVAKRRTCSPGDDPYSNVFAAQYRSINTAADTDAQ